MTTVFSEETKKAKKPTPDEAVAMLKEGNQRFVNGKSIHPHTDAPRLVQAGSENQGDHAYATVITCSDSRVPVEIIFDVGTGKIDWLPSSEVDWILKNVEATSLKVK
jgi:hypothetical protein